MSNRIESILQWCRRYVSVTFLIVVAFVMLVLFFNDNSILKSLEYDERIRELKREIKDNRDTLEHYIQLNHSLNTDHETLERIVREQYHMQRINEDVYLIEDE